ncbi:ATP-binding protein [Streptomyces sp. SID14478]|uniref:ATP-binding protein n=1 Tax=Streptomyces sp. SID14478 TaxID=2706073 RepID=UPI0013DBE734|nr:ATP-binding protein [Streptomyces sp. SID14478]NEB77610.1 ATP-binding protein [Streptomyces sp. SID14478]
MTDLTCPEARSHVRTALQPLLETLPAQQATLLQQDACLIASELVTNALLHAGGVRDFLVSIQGSALTIHVSDFSTTLPTHRATARATPGGHGWLIIQRLSADVAIEPDALGKTISVTLDALRAIG